MNRLVTALQTALAVLVTALVIGSPAMADEITNPSGVRGDEVPAVRQGVSLRIEREIVSIFESAAEQINRDLGKAIMQLADSPENNSASFRAGRAAELLAQINTRLRAAQAAGVEGVQITATDAYRLGLRQAVTQADKLGLKEVRSAAGARPSFSVIDQQAVALVATDSAARMIRGLRDHGQRAERVFRSLSAGPLSDREVEVNRAIGRGLVTGDPVATDRAIRDLFRDETLTGERAESYRKIGAKQITVGNWTGPVRTYAETVQRTRMREATVKARHNRLQELGREIGVPLDLVQITGRVSVNFCTRFIGLVCSLSGARDGYPALADLPGGGPPFHPRCSKGTTAYVPELVSSARAKAHDRALRAYERARTSGTLLDDLRT